MGFFMYAKRMMVGGKNYPTPPAPYLLKRKSYSPDFLHESSYNNVISKNIYMLCLVSIMFDDVSIFR